MYKFKSMTISKMFILFLLATALMVMTGCAQDRTSSAPNNVPLEEILQNIRAAYGEDYLPNVEIPEELLESQYGLSSALYEEAYGETPMIGAHPDVVLVVKAAPGKDAAVEEALNNARDRLISNELQYPMNIAKTNAAQVVREGDYVALLLVGAINEAAGGDEQADSQYAHAEVQKAVDAFRASFQ